jgi:ectoine hydroxylase-related dioxygenase (phytanoyl-CoA dioxygenase family)
MISEISTAIERGGFALVPGVFGLDEIEVLKGFFAQTNIVRAERRGATYGARNLLDLAEIRQVAASPVLATHLLPLLGPDFRVVRGIFFDKTLGANWPVLWHQDLSLAVKNRHDMPGWTGWSVKRDVLHVQAPADILARIVTIRMHLDDCPAENGALRVIPGSHTQGLLSRDVIRSAVATRSVEVIVAAAGDVLLMRPLLLHGSSPAKAPSHRRVLHLEFAQPTCCQRGSTGPMLHKCCATGAALRAYAAVYAAT